MKTEFELDIIGSPVIKEAAGKQLNTPRIRIIGKTPEDKPYVNIEFYDSGNYYHCIGVKDKDLERLAVNILKALNSKKLKQ